MNILITGVGGQGALLAARIIGLAASAKGFDVKVSEVHGMSQREGSVETYVRFSREKIYAPIFGKGDADVVLALEALEALRNAAFVKKNGTILVNTQEIDPMPVITGKVAYPADIAERLKETGAAVVEVDALALAREAGNVKAVNVVMLGALAKLPEIAVEFTAEDWEKAIGQAVKPAFLEVNLKAFGMGVK